jgi:uncharacterized protein (TIGR00255 family)
MPELLMQSMTGYGRGHAPLGTAQFVVEVRAVNHRFLDLRVRVDSELANETGLIEEHVRKHVGRGRVDVSARLEGKLHGAIALDLDRARAAFAQLVALRDELAPNEPVPLTLLSGVPGLFSEAGAPDADARAQAARKAVAAACEALVRMRKTEGEALREDLLARTHKLSALRDELSPAAAAQSAKLRDKLQLRIQKLVEGSELVLDQGRLELEVALLADRADVSEELTRLASHVAQLHALLTRDTPEPVGRKLEFILQELGREANTAGAKVADATAALHILEIKAELERMREQVQNLV